MEYRLAHAIAFALIAAWPLYKWYKYPGIGKKARSFGAFCICAFFSVRLHGLSPEVGIAVKALIISPIFFIPLFVEINKGVKTTPNKGNNVTDFI